VFYTSHQKGKTKEPKNHKGKQRMVRLEKKQRDTIKTNTLRFSLRIYSEDYPEGKVTSMTLRKSIVIIWILFGTRNFTFEKKKGLHDRIEGIITDFIYESLNSWPHADGKGLSDFISDKMFEDLLVKKDYRKFKQLMESI